MLAQGTGGGRVECGCRAMQVRLSGSYKCALSSLKGVIGVDLVERVLPLPQTYVPTHSPTHASGANSITCFLYTNVQR
jgi:hypothetical protein